MQRRLALFALCLSAIASSAAWAEDPPPAGWQDSAELGLVATTGNSEGLTLGFKNSLWREWDKSKFTFNLGGVRVESTTITRFATVDDLDGRESKTDAVTAENYYLNLRYDRKISERFFWYAGTSWDRNRPAGVENRVMAGGGVGNIWYDTEDVKFRTNYGVTYTDQEDVVENPAADDSFAGAQLGWEYKNKFGASAEYANTLVVDVNLDDTSDQRFNMLHSIAVAMSKRLALKVSHQMLYDAEPALIEVPLFPADTTDPDPEDQIGTTSIEADDLDMTFTVSVVANF